MSLDVRSRVDEALNELVKELSRIHGPVEVYLFGSFAKGDWLEDSDIDIIVVSESFEGKSMAERVNMVRRLATDDLAIEILAYTPQELKKALKKSVVLQDAATYWRKIT